MSLDSFSKVLQNEIDLLENIYAKELKILISENCVTLVVNLPIESIKDSVNNFINLRVAIICDLQYPNSIPKIIFSDYWGLNDCDIENLYEEMRSYLAVEIAEPDALIFNLITKISEQIDDNIPKCNCSICLDHFVDPKDIYVTVSHHYFHKKCIESYACSQKRDHEESVREAKQNNQFIEDCQLPKLKMKCPLCRTEDLIFDHELEDDLCSWITQPVDESKKYLTEEIVAQMKKMSLSLENQNRAIIDREKREREEQEKVLAERSDQSENNANRGGSSINRRHKRPFRPFRGRSNFHERKEGNLTSESYCINWPRQQDRRYREDRNGDDLRRFKPEYDDIDYPSQSQISFSPPRRQPQQYRDNPRKNGPFRGGRGRGNNSAKNYHNNFDSSYFY